MTPNDTAMLEQRTADPGARLESRAPETPRRRWIANLVRGDSVDAVFLLRRVELKTSRSGASYVSAELQDRTGTIPARVWCGAPGHATAQATVDRLRSARFARAVGAVANAHGTDSRDPDGLALDLQSLVPAVETDADVRDLCEHSPEDPERLLAELRRIIEDRVTDAWVRRVLLAFLDDDSLVARLKRAPAASSYHHAYVGGLIEHIVSLTRAVERTCDSYPRLDRSLMIAGAFLHDVGKVDELSWERGLQYTDAGQLVGHIAIGVLLLEEKIRAIEGFPPRLREVLMHLILSHHGTKEFGSPVLPAMPEALALHYLDNLDGKLWSAWRAMDDPRGEPAWSPHSRHLGRKIYRAPFED